MKRAVNSLLHTVFSRRPLRSVLCWRGARRGSRVAITFDDGPNDHTTPRVLEILDEHGVRCTFFVLGREIVKHPGILKAIATAGHEIGIHGYDHTGDHMLGQITRCKALLAEQDVACNLFRPPLGRRGVYTCTCIRILHVTGYILRDTCCMQQTQTTLNMTVLN